MTYSLWGVFIFFCCNMYAVTAYRPGPDGEDLRIASPVLNRLITCQNMTLAQIGDELQRVAGDSIYNSVAALPGRSLGLGSSIDQAIMTILTMMTICEAYEADHLDRSRS